ncbi:MAG: DUF4956 domain-containing protein [Arthrobacter sp.]|jgi:hypothetical protein|nr:DUF4956 domain-containing protein [Arthrobacter sp.]
MLALFPLLLDVVAISVLAFGLYYPRHRRRDLLTAFIGINLGVLAVAQVLAGSTIAAGIGLGLFGVLSIIRLRSTEISQREMAYYFSALALGLINGITAEVTVLSASLSALLLVGMAVADAPALMARSRQQIVTVDRAIADEDELSGYLEALLGGRVRSLQIQRLDLVNDSTLVDVRYELGTRRAGAPRAHTTARRIETPAASPAAGAEAYAAGASR